MKIAIKYLTQVFMGFAAFSTYAQEDTIKTTILREVKVTMSLAKTMQELPLNITVISTKGFYQTNQNSLDILKQNSGINIRTNGGYGAYTDFFINGISGKQIKFFVDGNPVDNLGETQGINIVPVQQTERFEIYKGVVPVELGTDALGGAVNIVTRKEIYDYLDFSTAYSSFNTTKTNLQFRKNLSQNFYLNVLASYNHSDNDYKVLAEVPNEFGNIEIKNSKRFHNQFAFSNVKMETGITNTKWANVLSIQAQYAQTYSELQHNVIMRQPYGQALYTDKLKGVILKYQKANLLKNLDFNAFFNYNETQSVFTDTTKNVYNWEGKVVDRRSQGGELTTSGSELATTAKVFNTRQIFSYFPSENIKISIANTYQTFNRFGSDPFALAFYGVDFFTNPQTMQKNVTGLGVETKWFNERLVNLSSVKYFHASYQGNKRNDFTIANIDQTIDRFGFNTAFSYFFTSDFFVKTSYEKATRLPDEIETFGDLRLVKPNPSLVPELSDNANVNLVFRHSSFEAELAGFYRKIENSIFLPPSITYSQYQNLLKLSITGVESAIKIKPNKWLAINANFTFQDLRNKSVVAGFGINDDRYKDARMPNIPFLFANSGVTMAKDSVFKKAGRVAFYWNCNFVQEYYLFWSVDGDPALKNIIPAQFINHLGFSFAHHKSGVSLAFDVNNVFNTLNYDNFKVQLPGRTYSLKVRFYYSKL